jgi:hypothetical protein
VTTMQLRDLIERRPFVPFTIRTTDGREYRAAHPELIWLPPGFNTAHLVVDGRMVFLDIAAIGAIIPDEAAPGTPGVKRRKR